MSYTELIENKSSREFWVFSMQWKRMWSFSWTDQTPSSAGWWLHPADNSATKYVRISVKIPFCINEQTTINELKTEKPNVKFLLCKSYWI